MANVDAVNKALAAKPQPKDLRLLIEEAGKELARALPDHMRPERLVRIALTCIRTTPQLAQCTPESFLGALFTAAQMGIEPVAGRAYLLPFYNSRKKADGSWHKVLEAQFVLGYKGAADLFYRHEKAVMLNWGVVKEKDDFDYQLGTDAFLKHHPAKGERGATVGFYVIAHLADNAKPFIYMSVDECMEHGKKHSKTYDKKTGKFYDSSPWATNPDAMCQKTALLQLAKVLPLSIELQRALEADETSRDYRKGFGDALDMPATTNWTEPKTDDEPPEIAKVSDDKTIPFGE